MVLGGLFKHHWRQGRQLNTCNTLAVLVDSHLALKLNWIGWENTPYSYAHKVKIKTFRMALLV
jgi:hypothetical protein